MVYIDVSLFLNQKEHFVKTQNVMSNKRKRNVHFSFFCCPVDARKLCIRK